MSTNSLIFYQDSVGRFHGISCHFDGGLNGVGITLYRHYQEINKIKQLISLGDIRVLDKECVVGPKYQSMDYSGRHKDNLQFGYTFAFHRDLNHEFIAPTIKYHLKDLESYYHVYVWKDDQWYTYNSEQEQWTLLKDELIQLYQERSSEYLYLPKTVEIECSYEDYMSNIRKRFIIVKKANIPYVKNDYIKFKATHEEQPYELLLKVVDIMTSEAINDNYQLVCLSEPSKDWAWFYPVHYVK